jgi:hypothetical protein
MISVNFFPNDPVPPVTSTDSCDQFTIRVLVRGTRGRPEPIPAHAISSILLQAQLVLASIAEVSWERWGGNERVKPKFWRLALLTMLESGKSFITHRLCLLTGCGGVQRANGFESMVKE